MAENPPSEGTRKLEEDGGPEDCYDSDDDLIMYADGRKMSIHLQKEYHRQVKESEGFDITLDLTLDAAIGAPIIPQRGKENKPKFVDLSQLAIATFNSQNATKYEFVKNVTVNTSYAAGMWCYITFQARDADDTIKTFQALAWWGIDGDRDVRFCRFKKSSKC
uniref:Multicystatin isoform X1 n=1 Tax=Nicotiana tabacum TaxID=4097 RepID=A0A1S4D2N4_TOBAC|nr:PREDICTED: multicystatin-like isoform X1 [Nicotiana tabacum]